MIEVQNVKKRYDKLAVDSLTFTVQPGIVTGFLGPNGAGKSTTLRMIARLDKPTAGTIRVNGGDYRSAKAPMKTTEMTSWTSSLSVSRALSVVCSGRSCAPGGTPSAGLSAETTSRPPLRGRGSTHRLAILPA